MIADKFDPTLPLCYVGYGRMSSKEQNPRSPDQQFDEIERTRSRQGYNNWRQIKNYRDDGISGRYQSRRPGFKQMLNDIRSGLLKVDAILVDTLERFGRFHDIQNVRNELRNKYGVLVLTADTGFADPTSLIGQVYGTLEAARATSAGAQKAHDVLRGKIDVVLMKRWPGGPPPIGYKLAARTETVTRHNGKTMEVNYHVLEPDGTKAELVRRCYQVAHDTGWGRSRIAKHLNADPEFVNRFGKISESLVGSILTSTIYKGRFRFNYLATDIMNDSKVVRRKDPEEVIYVDDFCPGIVDPTIVDKVHADAHRRGEKIRALRAAKKAHNDKQIQPFNPGLILVYPLTGLVRCRECSAAMRPSKSGAKSKDAASYYYYRCPCANDGRCSNKLYLRGPWLWNVVIARLREVLFPLPESGNGQYPAWLCELIAEVRDSLAHKFKQEQSQRPMLEQELKEIRGQISGWNQTLANSSLSSRVRENVEASLDTALDRQQAIELELDLLTNEQQVTNNILQPKAAVDCLKRLENVLAGGSPSDINVELSLHIESILVSSDGTVVMRTNRLGIFEGATEILAGDPSFQCLDEIDEKSNGSCTIRPRALTRRKTTTSIDGGVPARPEGLIDQSIKLPDQWVDQAIFKMPELTSWADQHSAEVFHRRQKAKLSYAKLAKEFGVTPPTARAAVKSHLKKHPEARDEVNLPRGGQRPPKFDLAKFGHEARALWEAGWSKLKLAEKFGCSAPTVDKAVAWAYEQDGLPVPSNKDRQQAAVRKARALHDAGQSLDTIAETMKISDVTARRYLRQSFADEGQSMPDLRTRAAKSR